MIRHCLLALMFGFSLPLSGQDSLKVACDSAVTTIDMRRCASRELDSAQANLRRYLQEARRVAANRAQLDSSQTAWLRFRDVACRAAGSEVKGGTAEQLFVLNCLIMLTHDRVRYLYDFHLMINQTQLPNPSQ